MDLAPICIPIEIRRAGRGQAAAKRWFRLGLGVGLDRIRLRSPLPAELFGRPLQIRLHLPPPTERLDDLADRLSEVWDGALRLSALAGEVIMDAGTERERSEARLLLLQNVAPSDRLRIENYITLRTMSDE